MKSVLEAMDEMRQIMVRYPYRRTVFLMHPKTRDAVAKGLVGNVSRDLIWSNSIRVNENVPHTVKKWKPPRSGKFTGYGPEDEVWMRPLGIGVYDEFVVYEVDEDFFLPKLSFDMPFLMTSLTF